MKKYIFILILNYLVVSCMGIKHKIDDSYEVVNLAVTEFVERENDTIFLMSKRKNSGSYFLKLLDEGNFIRRLKSNTLKNIFLNKDEINNFKNQLKQSSKFNFKKVESNLIKEYKPHIQRKDAQGNLITDRFFFLDFERKKYGISKPIFTIKKEYAFILVTKIKSYTSIKVYVKKNKHWYFYKNIPISIS